MKKQNKLIRSNSETTIFRLCLVFPHFFLLFLQTINFSPLPQGPTHFEFPLHGSGRESNGSKYGIILT